ncbi:MAG TPA: futalosine hydrolase [Bacteroidia bacterium]|nr:futalosine hydrolase [Bacteroidia bacterium]HNS13059.1 futalosine hydrolase [Bacteroidia bacterium]
MEILLVAATEEEMAPLRDIWFRKHKVEFLVTGVGMVATSYALAKAFTEKPFQLAINTGLAGAFDRNLRLGEVVRVSEDILAELGAEDDDDFLTLKEIGLEGVDIFLNMDEVLLKELNEFKKVRSITINTVHGNEASINKIRERLHPHIETMEGAAFFYACGKSNIPAIQLRAISNFVERRNKSNWDIPLALKSMKQAVALIIEKI